MEGWEQTVDYIP